MLDPIPGLTFDPDLHRYALNGQWLCTSVTKVVSDLTPQARAHIDATRHEWEPRGNTCHAALESALLGHDGADYGDYAEIIQPLLDHAIWQGCTVLAVEYRLCDQRKSLGGSFDFLIRTGKGKVVLGDLKTVGKAPAIDSRKPATAQLGAYLALLIDHHPFLTVDSCCTVVAGPGRTRLIPQDPNLCLGAWVDAWDAYQLAQPF